MIRFLSLFSKPLRVGLGHNHSVNVSGKGGGLAYTFTANLGDKRGVMKGDQRMTYGIGARFKYYVAEKLTLGYSFSYRNNESKNSPYGSFSGYSKLNPYESVLYAVLLVKTLSSEYKNR